MSQNDLINWEKGLGWPNCLFIDIFYYKLRCYYYKLVDEKQFHENLKIALCNKRLFSENIYNTVLLK